MERLDRKSASSSSSPRCSPPHGTMASSSHDPIDSPPRAGTSTDEIPARGDPFADLIPWSSPPTARTNHQSRLRTPPTLERTSSNDANLRHRSNTSSSVQHIPSLSDTVNARKRCNTADHVADGRLVAASHVACRPILQPNSPQSLILPNKYTELNDNNYINNKNKHMLSPLECNEINGHRGRTSTLESVMAVKSLSSTAHSVANSENDKRLANHSHKRRAAASKDNYFFDNALQSWQGIASNNGHEIQDRLIMSMSSHSDDVLFQDDPSDVSSLSDDDDDADHGDNDDDHQRDPMEKDDKKKKSCTLSRATSPACVPTGGVRAMAALFKKPLVKNITSGSKPVAIRLRQGSDTAKDTVTTATTSAMHTLETMDNFDVPSAFSPLGALSGEEELSFFKSGSKSSVVGGGSSSVASGDQFQSLHGYHRRCKHGVPAYRSAKQNVGIQNSWLVSSSGGPHVQWRERDVDLIDMSDELNHDSVSPPPTTVTSIPNVVVGGACEASVVSGASSHVFTFKSGDVSLPDIGTMSISTGGEQSQRSLPTQGRLISRPPVVGRSKTSPAFLNDDPVLFSRSRYRNPMPQSSFQSGSANMRKRPSQIATGVINSPCMISSIALSEATSPKAIAFPRRPSFSRNSWNVDCSASQVTFGSLHTKGEVTTPSLPSLEEQEDDENASFGSFAEELRRKDKRKMIAREVKHFMKHAIIDPKPVVRKGMKWLGMEVKPADKSLKRADGCLT